MRQLDSKHRRLKRVQSEVAADPLVKILRLRAVVAEQTDLVRKRRIVGRHQPGIAERAEVLARKEREAADGPIVPA